MKVAASGHRNLLPPDWLEEAEQFHFDADSFVEVVKGGIALFAPDGVNALLLGSRWGRKLVERSSNV